MSGPGSRPPSSVPRRPRSKAGPGSPRATTPSSSLPPGPARRWLPSCGASTSSTARGATTAWRTPSTSCTSRRSRRSTTTFRRTYFVRWRAFRRLPPRWAMRSPRSGPPSARGTPPSASARRWRGVLRTSSSPHRSHSLSSWRRRSSVRPCVASGTSSSTRSTRCRTTSAACTSRSRWSGWNTLSGRHQMAVSRRDEHRSAQAAL